MRILGLSGWYHDSAAALLQDGRVVAAAQEERFSRAKHDPRFPARAAAWCLSQGGIRAADLDAVAWFEKPFWKFDRLLSGFRDEAPRGFARFATALPLWLRSRLWVRAAIQDALGAAVPVRFLAHHESHAAAAYGPSPFARAAVLTIDGVGEWATNGLWRADGNRIEALREIRYPDSLGLLYSAFTAYCGFAVNDGEYKLMGLAPYGEPRYAGVIRDRLVEVREDGSYRLAPECFAYRSREAMTTARFDDLFGGPPRDPRTPLDRRHCDVARSIQAVTEQILLAQARFARRETGCADLCLAGGVALNCVANGRLAREGVFDRVWIQPAAGDAGGALGAAWGLWLRTGAGPRTAQPGDAQRGSLLGPAFDDDAVEAALRSAGNPYERVGDAERIAGTAEALAAGETVAWFQGAMEFGPRALGNRSLLADPRDPRMQSRLNLQVKLRESFRPFAPVVRERDAAAWFDLPAPSPYMLLVGSVRGAAPSTDPMGDLAGGTDGVRSLSSPLPAVTHVDGSARVQTVPEGANPDLERLLEAFGARTGCPVLVNTSFNVKDEPIVCTPEDAVRCFNRTGLDRLVAGPFVARKAPPRPPARTPAPPRRAGRALVSTVVGAAVATGLWALGSSRLALAAAAIVAAGVALELGFPRAARAVEAGLDRVARAIVLAVTLPVLAVVFLGVFWPWGRLRRAPEDPRDTFWREPTVRDHDPAHPY